MWNCFVESSFYFIFALKMKLKTNTLEKRYEHIKWALDNQNNLDEDELKFIIKNGFVSKIYISEGVVKKYKPSDFGTQANLFNEILKGKNNVLGTDVFDICKAVESRGKAYNTKGIIIEHVVPAKVYLGDVKEKSPSKSTSI